MNNDLISREAAIGEIKKHFCTDCDNYKGIRCRACNFDDAMGVIEDMPSAQQWIPCSERLPDNLKSVLVYFREVHNQEYNYDIAIYAGGKWFGNVLEKCSGQVIAWQPLPEPYVEVEE